MEGPFLVVDSSHRMQKSNYDNQGSPTQRTMQDEGRRRKEKEMRSVPKSISQHP